MPRRGPAIFKKSSDRTLRHGRLKLHIQFRSGPFGDGYAGVFRCDNKAVRMNIYAGFSSDGINWKISDTPIEFEPGNTPMIRSDYKYDPRVTWIEDRWWITWCNGCDGPTLSASATRSTSAFLPMRERLPPLQPQRRALPAEDRRTLRRDVAPIRQRPHPLRRHIHLLLSRHEILGRTPLPHVKVAPSRTAHVGNAQGRRRLRAVPHRRGAG